MKGKFVLFFHPSLQNEKTSLCFDKNCKIQHIARRYWWPNRIEWSMRNGQNQRIQQAKTNKHIRKLLYETFCLFNDDAQVFMLFYCQLNVYAVHTEISLYLYQHSEVSTEQTCCTHRLKLSIYKLLSTNSHKPKANRSIHTSPNTCVKIITTY